MKNNDILLSNSNFHISGVVVVVVVSHFNGTSTPIGSYSAKTGDNDCNVQMTLLRPYIERQYVNYILTLAIQR